MMKLINETSGSYMADCIYCILSNYHTVHLGFQNFWKKLQNIHLIRANFEESSAEDHEECI